MMNKKFTVYEAGGMSGLDFETMNAWRVNAKRLLRIASDNQIHIINPVNHYNFNMNPNTYTESEVKKFDLQMVKTSDLILVNLDLSNGSIGTAMELCMAHDVWDKPVIGYGKQKSHPWFELCVTKRCETLEQAVDYIINYYFINM